MSIRQRRQFLLREKISTERFVGETETHFLMGPQFRSRLAEIEQELASLPTSGPEARLEVYFGDGPVDGSRAIDAKFLAEALPPLLEAVKSQYSAVKNGRLGERGPRKDESEARLLLASTPRGSFGIELVPPHTDDLFAEARIAEVLGSMAQALHAAAGSEDDLFALIDELEPRAYTSLKTFFQKLSESQASVRMQSGDVEVRLSSSEVNRANERLSETTEVSETRQVMGRWRGALLDSWRFNFSSEHGEPVSGRIDSSVSEESIAELKLNEFTTLDIRETITTTPTGKQHRKYLLLGISQPGVKAT